MISSNVNVRLILCEVVRLNMKRLIPKKDVFTILSHPSVKVSPCFANVNFDRYLVTSIEQALRRTLDLPLPWPACHGLPAMENKPYTMENVHINVRRKTS